MQTLSLIENNLIFEKSFSKIHPFWGKFLEFITDLCNELNDDNKIK